MRGKSQKQLESFAKVRCTDTSAAVSAKKKKVDDFAIELGDRILSYRERGITSLGKISDQLVKDGVTKRNGGTQWRREDVARLLERQARLSVGKSLSLDDFFD